MLASCGGQAPAGGPLGLGQGRVPGLQVTLNGGGAGHGLGGRLEFDHVGVADGLDHAAFQAADLGADQSVQFTEKTEGRRLVQSHQTAVSDDV